MNDSTDRPFLTRLPQRGVLRLSGEDRETFLQGLVSNDVRLVAEDRAVFGALLTPQGKYLHDFFIVQVGPDWLLDCDGPRADDLFRRLRLYRLRSRIDLAVASADWTVATVFGPGAAAALALADRAGTARPLAGGTAFVDPRLDALGVRLILPAAQADTVLADLAADPVDPDAYDGHRLGLGVPDGSRDLHLEKSTLLEANYDALGAISWDKGCYMGQELTARTRYRGLLKRRLVPVTIDGPLPEPGTPVHLGDKNVGEIRSGRGTRAIALLRLEAAGPDAALSAGDAAVRPVQADWQPVDAA